MPSSSPANLQVLSAAWQQLSDSPISGHDPNGHALTIWIDQPSGRPPARLMSAAEHLRDAWCVDPRFEELLQRHTTAFIPEGQRPEGLVEGDTHQFHTEPGGHKVQAGVDADGLWPADFAARLLATIQATLNQLLSNKDTNAGDAFFQAWGSSST